MGTIRNDKLTRVHLCISNTGPYFKRRMIDKQQFFLYIDCVTVSYWMIHQNDNPIPIAPHRLIASVGKICLARKKLGHDAQGTVNVPLLKQNQRIQTH